MKEINRIVNSFQYGNAVNNHLEIFSWKTTSHNGQIEVCLLVSRLLSDCYGMFSSMKKSLGYKGMIKVLVKVQSLIVKN